MILFKASYNLKEKTFPKENGQKLITTNRYKKE
jgi:hypothetical protein